MSGADSARLLVGGCQCGAVRYAIRGNPLSLYACHCRECRKQSASAYGMSLTVPRSAFRLTQGAVKSWSRRTDSGGMLRCLFCPVCGSRVWHERESAPGTLNVKGGSLDDPPDLGAAVHIWTSRKLSGVVIPAGAVQFPEEPD